MGLRLFLIAATASFGTPAAAAEPHYLGTWIIAEGHPAPWVDPAKPSTEPFDDRILGRTITFAPARIVAPPPLSCRRPSYAWHEVPPEALFQGALPDPEAEALASRRA